MNPPKAEFQVTVFISKLRKRNKISSLLVYVLHKHEIRHFHVVVVQKREGNLQKSVVHVQSCCFAYSTYCFFFTFSLLSASLDLKVHNVKEGGVVVNFLLWHKQAQGLVKGLLSWGYCCFMSGLFLNLGTLQTGHVTLFNQWEGMLLFTKTSTRCSKIFTGADGARQSIVISFSF